MEFRPDFTSSTTHQQEHIHIQPPEHCKKELCDLDYSQDPPRILSNYLVHAPKPFNAEPHLPLLINSGHITPTDVFFKRNHGPIPDIRLQDHRIYIGVQRQNQSNRNGLTAAPMDIVEWKVLTMDDIMNKWPKATITASLQCAGNRREGLAQVKEVKGVIWKAGTISNAVWAGPRLCDILRNVAGVPEDLHHEMIRNYHVSFEADDHVKEDVCYGSSIPLRKAMDPLGDVILAYEMNGKPLTRDHGFPLRVIVPGYIGARSVKFLQKIVVQPQESNSFFQKLDYKILPPWVDASNVDSAWDLAPSLGEMNVQCVICTPMDKEIICSSKAITIKGYAIAGGGRAIYRVELSIDGGKTWEAVDKLEQTPDKISGMYWSWALWEKKVLKLHTTSELVVRAYDSSGNMQPEFPVWNYRGVMNNAWFRVSNVTQMPQSNM
ncbi:Oxidoreductase, molybdopterin-binding domain-containing protein [Lobosporangium transversale]|uniref:Oxidoreductase, molybdopterin-binding domain-containing protein n=1 Tax=Lobosporangium transversale TaxID=64571 RepID=A0A1Y2GQ02_9FUNG|nr:Oxidoreductase, molybdopterin-binding domain-containing protein [Lobosporangium transversale]XP_021881610.1 Oxidoreductase, molybdopterin-binding domain-containing protein [Lobosporangium transversale]ORZ16674.1 Oxidoreductase, molybdopterin-binding domain-containing protein [Lobosporangium transversale]ORZ16675.1 Oxidoreductase, molybdopterin-binding domain-containing protein [Lobosporangium transversale]|eukprot:XP_021881609.1 Oxidoreductase, molybdopterin-binding domain-containing protein [Lobosporangium transversale]